MLASCWLAASGDLGAKGRNDGYCACGGKRKRWCGRCKVRTCTAGLARHGTQQTHCTARSSGAGWVRRSVAQRADQGSQDCLGRCDTSRPMKLPPSHPNQKNHPALPAPCTLLGGCLYFTRHALLLGTSYLPSRLCTIWHDGYSCCHCCHLISRRLSPPAAKIRVGKLKSREAREERRGHHSDGNLFVRLFNPVRSYLVGLSVTHSKG